jgi:succinyl-CoA synthetase alpha subunit
MGILISADTSVIVQGITGREAGFWTEHMLDAGTKIVGGVTPGKGGQQIRGIPVYDTVRQIVDETSVEASVIFVPPRFAKDAAFEALDAGVRLVVLLTDGVPLHESLEIKAFSRQVAATVIGPNTPGLLTVGQAMLGFFPFWLGHVYQPGKVGLVSRSGSLINEVGSRIVGSGHGLTSAVGIGGDVAPCTRTVEVVALFEADPETRVIVVVGEIGGTMEEEVAELVKRGGVSKPIVALIAGRSAPPEKQMGHAGAIVSGGSGTYAGKVEALRKSGVLVAESPSQVGFLVKEALS